VTSYRHDPPGIHLCRAVRSPLSDGAPLQSRWPERAERKRASFVALQTGRLPVSGSLGIRHSGPLVSDSKPTTRVNVRRHELAGRVGDGADGSRQTGTSGRLPSPTWPKTMTNRPPCGHHGRARQDIRAIDMNGRGHCSADRTQCLTSPMQLHIGASSTGTGTPSLRHVAESSSACALGFAGNGRSLTRSLGSEGCPSEGPFPVASAGMPPFVHHGETIPVQSPATGDSDGSGFPVYPGMSPHHVDGTPPV